MCVVFTIEEEAHGRPGFCRGSDLLISRRSVADAITDARALARLMHAQPGDAVTLALASEDASMVLARYETSTAVNGEAA